jgi:hypothetical protein
VFVNYGNSIEIIRGVLENIDILYFGGPSYGPLLLDLGCSDSPDTDVGYRKINTRSVSSGTSLIGLSKPFVFTYFCHYWPSPEGVTFTVIT